MSITFFSVSVKRVPVILPLNALLLKPPAKPNTLSKVSVVLTSNIPGLFKPPSKTTCVCTNGTRITSLSRNPTFAICSPFNKKSYRSATKSCLLFLINSIFLNEPFSVGPPDVYRALNKVDNDEMVTVPGFFTAPTIVT